MSKPSVVIGIPAYNEEANIAHLIRGIYGQTQHSFAIQEVVVYSDHSKDRTAAMIRELQSVYPTLRLIDGKRRKGKPNIINTIFGMYDADIICILDADITLHDTEALEKLISPLVNDSSLALTTGVADPVAPKHFIERVVGVGVSMWDDAIRTAPHSDMYFFDGRFRAFRRSLYTQIHFPSTSADDVYPYLYCQTHGYKSRIVPDARVHYKLASTVRDYVNQMTRFLHSQQIQEHHFNHETVGKYYTVTPGVKLKVFLKHLLREPIWTLSYMAILVIPKIKVRLERNNWSGLWHMVTSTKTL